MKLSAYNVRLTRIQNMVKRHRTFGENTQMQPIHWRLLSHTAEFIMKMRKKNQIKLHDHVTATSCALYIVDTLYALAIIHRQCSNM